MEFKRVDRQCRSRDSFSTQEILDVDVIGSDEYSQVYPADLYDWAKNNGTVDPDLTTWAANPTNLMHYYEYPGGSENNPTGAGTNQFGVSQAQAFALANGKPFALCETGAGAVTGETSAGLADNPTFVQDLQSQLDRPRHAKDRVRQYLGR